MQAALDQYLEGYNTRPLLQRLRLRTAQSEGENKDTKDTKDQDQTPIQARSLIPDSGTELSGDYATFAFLPVNHAFAAKRQRERIAIQSLLSIAITCQLV